MSVTVGRGLFGSLRARVRAELSELARQNKTLRRVRSRFLRRLLVGIVSGVRLSRIVALYLALVAICVVAEWWIAAKYPCLLPKWGTRDLSAFVKDVDSYLIAGQVGILGIVSVAVGVVTLLSQRDDRSSAVTDVRLYYSESLAYEVVTSGVALVLVLFIQLFWPGQFALHYIQRHWENLVLAQSRGQTFELVLTVVHASWMLVNVLLFYQFIVTTLRFVEPDARKELRDRYTADTGLPRDLSRRLLRHLYLTTPWSLVGQDAVKEGPDIKFGLGSYFLSKAATEIETRFRRPSRLIDVRTRPLGLALRRWHRRVRRSQANAQQERRRPGNRKWEGEINVPITFDSELDGPTAWVLREGPVELTFWERQLIRLSFQFAAATKKQRDPLTPSNFMEELTERLVGQIENSALSGFKSALDELVSYHSFVLATQDTVDASGAPLNLSQIGVFFFETLDQEWIHLYRRVYYAAVDKLASEAAFIERLGRVAQRLIPSDARTVSTSVVTKLLDVGIYEVVALEDWVTRHTIVETVVGEEAQSRLVLAGSDRRAYERVVIDFIGAWESVLQTGPGAYKWRESENASVTEQWLVHARAWPYLRTHLHATAYFFALAVWNEDQFGAARYRDMLLRWLTVFYRELQEHHEYHHSELLSPELFGFSWEEVNQVGRAFMQYDFHVVTCENLVGVALRAAHSDVLILSAAATLSWSVQGRQSTDIGKREASAVLRRELIESEGSTLLVNLQPISPFWTTLAVIIKVAIGPWLQEGTYSASLNDLVRRFGGMVERRVVPGRIYSGWGDDGVDQLKPFLLAIMGANFQIDDARRATWIDWFSANDHIFRDGDRSVRAVIQELQALVRLIDERAPNNDFDAALSALSPEVNVVARRAELKSFLESLSQKLTNRRRDQLRAAPVDPTKLDRVRDTLRTELLAHGPDITVFYGFEIRRGLSAASDARMHSFGGIDKGLFVSPAMTDMSIDDVLRMTVEVVRDFLARDVWQEFLDRQREQKALDITAEAPARWRAILEYAPSVGPRPTLLVPFELLGDELSRWAYGLERPREFNIERVNGMPSGGGTGYTGTINGVHVYATNGLSNRAILFSGSCLRSVSYQPLPDRADVVDVSLLEGQPPERSRLSIRTCQVLEWSSDPFLEFTWSPITPP
jgi:hypothetical protein